MTVAHARALIDAERAIVEPLDDAEDAESLRRFAAWAMRFTPVVGVDPPDGLWLDVTGCERIHGGEKRLIRTVLASIDRVGFACRVAVAPTFLAASALARFGAARTNRIDAEELIEAVSQLPVRALRVDEDTIDGLAEVGIERIDQLLAVHRDELPARFGPEVLVAVDRMLGRAFEPIEPIRALAPPDASREFAGPVCDVRAIDRTVQDLIATLCDGLAKRGLGAREVRITFDRSDLDPATLDIALSRACADPRHLWTVVRPRTERINMGFGVDRITIRATTTGPIRHIQRTHWVTGATTAAQDARQISEMVDVLAGRLGADRVTMARPVATHIPDRAFRYEPIFGRRGRRSVLATSAPEALVPPRARPTRLFDRAEPAWVIAVTPVGPPYRIEWRSAIHEVVRAIGPERIACEWWRELTATLAGHSHDYFRICTREGRWLWMRRELVGAHGARWVVRGEWV